MLLIDTSLNETRVDLIAAFQYLKRAYKKDREELFKRAGSDRKRGIASYWKRVDLD